MQQKCKYAIANEMLCVQCSHNLTYVCWMYIYSCTRGRQAKHDPWLFPQTCHSNASLGFLSLFRTLTFFIGLGLEVHLWTSHLYVRHELQGSLNICSCFALGLHARHLHRSLKAVVTQGNGDSRQWSLKAVVTQGNSHSRQWSLKWHRHTTRMIKAYSNSFLLPWRLPLLTLMS